MLTVTGSDFAARTGIPFSGARDVVRWFEDGALIVAFANAFDSGFGTCFPEGSRWLLDAFETAWEEGDSSSALRTRLEQAYARSAREFVAWGKLPRPEPRDFGDSCAATLTAGVIDDEGAHFLFIGGERAACVRDGRVVAALAAHTVGARLVAEGADPALVTPDIASILSRVIETGEEVPETATWALLPGDVVELTSACFWRYAGAREASSDAAAVWSAAELERLSIPYVARLSVRVT